ncbi:MAG: N-formylglutamate amidohydrolase [Ahrensia sp.]|nr:N-formylglutamate amidohydrolase [Ahrensia sp.]
MAGGYNETDNPPFRVLRPAQQRVPFIFNAPHSGRVYPLELRNASALTLHQLRRSEDVLVDRLFDSAVALGAPMLVAQFPRAWLDVNREPYELDPKLFAEKLPPHANARSMRVSGGLGTIPRLVAENTAIYREKPKLAEALHRIESVYRPYHDALRRLMALSVVEFGYGVLVDCHSMPSQGARNERSKRPDIIVGDRYGTSCHGDISRELISRFGKLGYSVVRNKPYAGGFITEHYGRPAKGLHAIQIEINRALYMNEATLEPTVGFEALRNDIASILADLVSLPDAQFDSAPIAAE